MMNKTVTLAVAAAALFAAPAIALAQTSTQSPSTSTAPPAASSTQQKTMGDLKGLSVYSSDNQEIGTVASVQEGAGNQPQSIHVKTGGFLGIGQRTVDIPSAKFQKVGNRVNLTMTADEVKALPAASASQNGSSSPSGSMKK